MSATTDKLEPIVLFVNWNHHYSRVFLSDLIREAILQHLLVNHVVSKFTNIGTTGTDIRKLAKSRIVNLQAQVQRQQH